MKTKILIAALVIGALLCSGIVGAERPVKETVQKVKFVHYQDDSDSVKEKIVPAEARTNPSRVKTPKPTATATPEPDILDSPTPTETVTPEPTAAAKPEPTETATPGPTETVTVEPTETSTPEPAETETPEPAGTAIPEPTTTPTKTPTPAPTATALPEPTETATPTPTPVTSDLYRLKGTQWTQFPARYYVNPADSGLDAGAVTDEVAAALNTWDAEVGVDLVASEGTIMVPGANGNGRSEVFWAPITDTRIIAVATVYSTPSGIIEADVQMNSNKLWGIDQDGEGTQYALTDQFDVRNIATHELGHAFGLADLYESSAADLTMYGYSSRGQTKKISLGLGDILGIQAIYGV